jgi:hypothetical protein
VSRIALEEGVHLSNKPGRNRKLSDRDISWMKAQIFKNRDMTAENLAKEISKINGTNVSPRSVRRALYDAGLRAGRKIRKPAISQKNRKDRLAFAKSHRDWTVEDWKRVIFSDETKINRFGSDGRRWTWFRDEGNLDPRNVTQTLKGGGGSIMVWGCITKKGVGFMTEIEGIMDKGIYRNILEGELEDTIAWYDLNHQEVVFQQDNDPKHRAKSNLKYLEEQEYDVMLWPAQSPDLNPIENCWSYVKSKLYSYEKPASGLLMLWDRLQDEWEKIDQEYINNLYESMPKRMREVIRARGGWTAH